MRQETTARAFRTLRHEAGISQSALARLLRLSQTSISKRERGLTAIRPEDIEILLSLLRQRERQ